MTSLPNLSNPALLARFYLKNDFGVTRSFACALAQELGLTAIQPDDPAWTNPEETARLWVNELDQGEPLIIVYYAEGVEAAAFWREEMLRLRQALQHARADCAGLLPVGMTIVCQAVAPGGVDLEAVSGKAVATACGLAHAGADHLAQEIPGGRMWLLSAPVFRGSQWTDSEMTYLALCQEAGEEAQGEYFGDKKFIRPDLITHKVYNIDYNYRYLRQQKKLDDLLRMLKRNTKDIIWDGNRLSSQTSDRLQELAETYDKLLEISLDLHDFTIQLLQQKWNFSYLVKQEAGDAIWHFHQSRIENYHQELELKSAQTQRLLDSAGQAVNIAQARIEKAEAERQQRQEQRRKRQETLFTFIGAALAVPQLLTYEVLEQVLLQYGLQWQPASIFTLQIVITLGLATALAGLLRLSRKSTDS